MSCENNCARKCFAGDVDEKERYPFGCPTKEEADARYALKETEQLAKQNAEAIKGKADKSAIDNLSADISKKADKAQTDGEIKDIKNRLSSLERKDIRINSFTITPQTVEIGKTVNVTAAWNISKEADSMTINGEAVSGTSRVYPDVSATTKYTFEVADDKSSDSKAATVTFSNVIYYGSAPGTSDVSNLQKVLSENKARTFTVDAADGEYIIYAIPERLGSVRFFSGGFEGGFEDAEKKQITNSSGYTETYDVYRSSQRSLGKTTIEVKG